MDKLIENEVYRKLSAIYKDKSLWLDNIDYVAESLFRDSVRLQSKALWVLGEIGLVHPCEVSGYVTVISKYLKSPESVLRERSLTALGRIGRADFTLIKPLFSELFVLAKDTESAVRLSFIWASENIATNTPDVFAQYMDVFAALLKDADDRVRMESPEIFRVIGKRIPELVIPYLPLLEHISESDTNSVVRVHASGAVKATRKGITIYEKK